MATDTTTATTAPGATDLGTLIRSMQPVLDDEATYVFGHIPARSDTDAANILRLFVGTPVQMLYREREGWTVIVTQAVAREIQLQVVFPCRRITLNVQSSLEAVGFMAAVTTRLTALQVGVNPVSGFHHDHLYVPLGKEDVVMEALKHMAEGESS